MKRLFCKSKRQTQCDFLFVYEIKNRELDSICLIRAELENRGYTVQFVETWQERFWRTKPVSARVTVGFALYSDETLSFISSFSVGCKRFVNLQWEQLRSESELQKKDAARNIRGLSKKAYHISWGYRNREWLSKQCGIEEKNICLAGNVALDFCRPEFRDYYLSREQLNQRSVNRVGRRDRTTICGHHRQYLRVSFRGAPVLLPHFGRGFFI